MENQEAETKPTNRFPQQVFVASPVPGSGTQAYPMQEHFPQQHSQQNQQPVFSNTPKPKGPLRLKAKAVYRLGIATCSTGILVLVCGIVATALFGSKQWNIASGGIWGGLLIIVCGGFTIFASLRPRRRLFNTLNLIFNVLALVICVVTLVIYCLAIRYFEDCKKRYFHYHPDGRSHYYITNKNCMSPRGKPLVTYGILLTLTIIQMVVSMTVAVLCFQAYPETFCSGPPNNQNFSNPQYPPPSTTYQTGYAAMSPNIQILPPGQILYMLTPVAVTTQHPQNIAGAHQGNVLPQATLVMA